MLFADTDIVSAPMVMALKLASTAPVLGAPAKERSRTIGVAFADTSARHFGVADFVENDAFSNTEARLICMIAIYLSFILMLRVDARDPTRHQGGLSADRHSIWQDRPRH